MAHELTQRENGMTEMAFAAGVTPWHGLGQQLRTGASIEEWQVAAGMDWLIRRATPQYYADRAGTQLRSWDDKSILFRGDNGAPLGIVSPEYQIVQPYEVLEFFRDLTASSGFQLETAGTMFGGARFWALAKVTEAVISGWDKIGSYILLSTTADGSRATEVRETTVCVVCNNTLSAALSANTKRKLSVNHRQRFDAAKVQAELGLSLERFEQFTEVVDKLAQIKMSSAGAEAFFTNLMRKASKAMPEQGDDEDADAVAEDTKRRAPRGLETVMALFDGAGMGSVQKGRAGTVWGAINAVTEYVDHHSTAKTASHRLDRALWGSGDVLKTAALEMATAEFL